KDGRVAIVAGLRTPFCKQASDFSTLSALDLATMVVKELVQKSEIKAEEISQLVFGAVGPSLTHPNIAREIVFQANLPRQIEAYRVTRACATSLQAMVKGAEAILAGTAEVVVAGGVDTSSDVLVGVSRKLSHALLKASKAKDLQGRVKPLL